MEIVELAAPTAEQYSELQAGELEPWGGVAEALSWREKDRHIGVQGPGARLLAVAGSVIVEVEIDGAHAVPVLGIGGVFVTPSARGRGLVAMLLERLLAGSADGAVDRAMLFCRPPLTALYGKVAFVALAGPVTVEQPDGRIEMPLCTMWRPLRDHASWPPGPVELLGLPF